ncbi:MAG: carbohydrate kinase family protein [Actinomycetota bacterium]|nr:carbohydrate kinase family protein [Actinomycetota bacterium]
MICALGDLLLDVIVRVDGPIAADTDTYGRTAVAPGGQAANVAAWVAALGGEARFAGKRARDPAGRIVAETLAGRGVDVVGPEVAAGTGTVVSLAGTDGGRTMLTDRGVAPDLRADELDPGWFACRFLHVPSYSLVRSPIREAALEAVRIARTSGASVSVDLSSTRSIREYGADPFAVLVSVLRPDVVFANEAEFALVRTLDAPTIVVKRGARGCLVTTRDGSEEHPAKPATVVDGTGAGDALAAGFLLGGVELGLEAAARAVATTGGFPP